MGEFMAWMVGWILMLEYAIRKHHCSLRLDRLSIAALKGFSKYLPAWLTNPPIWLVNDYRSAVAVCEKSHLNPDTAIPHFLESHFDKFTCNGNYTCRYTGFKKRGKESTKFAGIMVAINLLIIASFIVTECFILSPKTGRLLLQTDLKECLWAHF